MNLVFEGDNLNGQKCQEPKMIIGFIDDGETIGDILKHLASGLPNQAVPQAHTTTHRIRHGCFYQMLMNINPKIFNNCRWHIHLLFSLKLFLTELKSVHRKLNIDNRRRGNEGCKYLVMLMALACVPLLSCGGDKHDQPDPVSGMKISWPIKENDVKRYLRVNDKT